MDEIIEEPIPAPIPAPEEGGLYLSEMAVYDLSRAAKWAKFLAIFGFVISGFVAIAALFINAIFSMINSMGSTQTPIPAAVGAVITVVYLIVAAVSFVINLFLYQFAERTVTAIAVKDTSLLERGIHRLQSYFKSIGILLIIELSLIALALIISVIAGAMFHH